MHLTAYEIALIGGGFTIVGALLGGWITYRFALCLSKINAIREAGARLRCSGDTILNSTGVFRGHHT